MSRHKSAALNAFFKLRPYQGGDPATSRNIFIGEDANFADDIEQQPIWPALKEYLADGPSFVARHKIHHPFVLPSYKGDGKRYHGWFDDIFQERSRRTEKPANPLPLQVLCDISFAELLDCPTVGRDNVSNQDLLDQVASRGHFQWLARLAAPPSTGGARTVFITVGASRILNQELRRLGLPPVIPEAKALNLKQGPWHQVFPSTARRCRIVVHFHPSAAFPAGARQALARSIRALIDQP
jgi:hypothetical protein